MIEEILATLHTLRDASRRSTLVCTLALAAGVIMIPLSYRGGVSVLDRWLLLGAGVAYVTAAALRVSRGLQMERQLDSEERFVRLAGRDGMSTPIKIGRPSTLVQAMRRAQSVPAPERRRALRGALRRSTQRLAVPPPSVALPALILLAALWIRIALVAGDQRSLLLFVAVIAVLSALLALEISLLVTRHRLQANLSVLVDHVISWWAAEQTESGRQSFRHEIFYRDVAERLGLA
jgi:hypothetical protein